VIQCLERWWREVSGQRRRSAPEAALGGRDHVVGVTLNRPHLLNFRRAMSVVGHGPFTFERFAFEGVDESDCRLRQSRVHTGATQAPACRSPNSNRSSSAPSSASSVHSRINGANTSSSHSLCSTDSSGFMNQADDGKTPSLYYASSRFA